MNKRGSVPLLVAGIIPTILFTGVFAAEATRYWLQQARLQAALDAGALYAAANINRPDRDANVQAIVAANYNENASSDSQITAANVQVRSVGTDKVEVSASAGYTPLTGSVSILGSNNTLTKTKVVGGSAVATQTRTGLELALVFDVTLSMIQSDGTDGNKSRIQSARDAATTMLQVLYGDDPNNVAAKKKWLEGLYISVVPSNVAVNYGPDNTAARRS